MATLTFTPILLARLRGMPSKIDFSILPRHIRNLVLNVKPEMFGKSEKDEADVLQWVEKIAEGQITASSSIKVLFNLSDRLYR